MVANRRDSLIDAAAQLLDRGGPAAVTLREVGRAAGVSHNAPYRHFADKSDLLEAIASRELERLADSFGKGGGRPREMLQAYLQWALLYPERFRLTFGPWRGDETALGKAAFRTRAVLVEAVAREQQEGAMPKGDPVRLAALLLASANGAASLALAGHLGRPGRADLSAENLVADLFDYLETATPA